MQKLDLCLDDIQATQLQRFASINKLSPEEAAAWLIRRRLQEWVASLEEGFETVDDSPRRH